MMTIVVWKSELKQPKFGEERPLGYDPFSPVKFFWVLGCTAKFLRQMLQCKEEKNQDGKGQTLAAAALRSHLHQQEE